MLESKIQTNILRWLTYNPRIVPLAWRNNSGAVTIPAKPGQRRRFVRYGMAGSADILGVLSDGRFLAIEVKTPKGKLTFLQKEFIDKINQSGGLAFVARSVDEVESRLKKELIRVAKRET